MNPRFIVLCNVNVNVIKLKSSKYFHFVSLMDRKQMVAVDLRYAHDFYVWYFCSAEILLSPRITLAVGERIKKGFI